MKRNMRFLLLFAILASSILAAYFISGCGDDTNNFVEPTPDNDTVIGTISGTARDAADNSVLVGCKVVWTHFGVSDSTVTDGNGYYTTGPTLSAGDYTVSFYPAGNSHAAAAYENVIVHSVGWHQTNTPNVSGVITEEVSLNAFMWPMTGTLSGYVYTALPMGAPGKEGGNGMALDGRNNVTAAPNVTVTLDLGDFAVIGDTYTATTDANGFFQFTNVPACENYDDDPTNNNFDADDKWIVLKTAQFTVNDVLYGHTEYSGALGAYAIEMGQMLPNIYAPLFGNVQRPLVAGPSVISYNWEDITPEVGSDLVVDFSHTMVPATVAVTLTPAVAHTKAWSNDNMTLTITPTSVLTTTTSYNIMITGEATNGLSLVDNDLSAGFDRDFTTEEGIMLLSTNFDGVAERVSTYVFTDLEVDANLTLTFNMPPNLTHTGTLVELRRVTANGNLVGITTSASGNTVTIDPDVTLSEGTNYFLEWKIYSDIEEDFDANGTVYQFTSSNDCVLAAPTIVDYDTEIDFDTRDIMLEWTVLPDADSFQVWAADDFNNLDRRVCTTLVAQQAGVSQSATVTLPTDFDRYQGDTTFAGTVLYTPFAAGTEVTFWVQGYCGTNPGAYSDPIVFSDNVGPADFILNSNHWLTADNSAGVNDTMPYIRLGHASDSGAIEYVQNTPPVVTFGEGGGDPAFVPSVTTFDGWDGGLRYSDSALFVTIPAGSVGAGDWMYVTISDNSGNAGTDSIRLAPYIDFIHPSDTSTGVFGTGTSYGVEWTTMEPQGGNVVDVLDLFISYDGGTTWDTLMAGNDLHSWADDADAGTKTLSWLEDTVRSANAVLALATDGGGFKFTSDAFVYAGLKMMFAAADSTDLVDYDTTGAKWWFDREVTDSSNIPFSFETVGFDTVYVRYGVTNWAGIGAQIDTVVVSDASTVSTLTSGTDFMYYPYNTSNDYNCVLGVWGSATAGNHPWDRVDWTFPVKNDRILIQQPNASSSAPYRANFNITWYNITSGFDSLASNVNVYWADMKGDPTDTTWTQIGGGAVPNKGFYIWEDVPPTIGTDSALVRIEATDAMTAVVSALFEISGLDIVTPEGGEEWEVGSTNAIEWTNYGIMDQDSIRIEYFVFDADDEEWKLDDTLIKAFWPNDGDWDWTVPAPAYDSVQIRVREWSKKADFDDSLVQEMSNTFTVSGFEMLAPTKAIYFGRIDTMTWKTVGTFPNVTLGIGSPGHSYFDTVVVGTTNNTGQYIYDVPDWDPDSSATDGYVYIKTAAAGGTAADTIGEVVSEEIILINPQLNVTRPLADTIIFMSTIPSIQWTTYGNRVGTVMIEFSKDNGANYTDTLIVNQTDFDAQLSSYNWVVPVDPLITDSAQCKIRVTEEWSGQGTPLQGESPSFWLKPNPK